MLQYRQNSCFDTSVNKKTEANEWEIKGMLLGKNYVINLKYLFSMYQFVSVKMQIWVQNRVNENKH